MMEFDRRQFLLRWTVVRRLSPTNISEVVQVRRNVCWPEQFVAHLQGNLKGKMNRLTIREYVNTESSIKFPSP